MHAIEDDEEMMVTCLQPVAFPRLHVMERMARCGRVVVAGTAQLNRWHQATYHVVGHQRELPLVVPILHEGRPLSVNEARMEDWPRWRAKHLRTVIHHYRGTRFFRVAFPEYEALINDAKGPFGPWAYQTMRWSAMRLGLDVRWHQDYEICEKPVDPNDWIIAMCRGVGADSCYCGASGYHGYMKPEYLEASGIRMVVQDWKCPRYRHHCSYGFVENVSALDLIMNLGEEGGRILA